MKQNGFTLVEMMVALFIFALIATTGVVLLSVGVRAQATATARLDDTAAVRRMSVLLANDFAQVMPRTTRASDGAVLRAFTGNDGTSNALILGYVRGGWSNLENAPRAGVQRVDVVLESGRLERRGYAALDGNATATAIVLAEGVTAVAMRYRDRKGDWRQRWDEPLIASLPAAVEMTLTRGREPPLTLAFVAGPNYP